MISVIKVGVFRDLNSGKWGIRDSIFTYQFLKYQLQYVASDELEDRQTDVDKPNQVDPYSGMSRSPLDFDTILLTSFSGLRKTTRLDQT